MASYSPVFSSQFIVFTDAAPNTEFAVPAGFTAVVRDLTCQTNFGGVIAQAALANDVDAPDVVFAQVSTGGAPGYDQWTGRVVIPGGGFIRLFVSSVDSGTSIYVGGYLLRDTLT